MSIWLLVRFRISVYLFGLPVCVRLCAWSVTLCDHTYSMCSFRVCASAGLHEAAHLAMAELEVVYHMCTVVVIGYWLKKIYEYCTLIYVIVYEFDYNNNNN